MTVCSDFKRYTFGRIQDHCCRLSPLGELVQQIWTMIPDHFPHARLHVFVVMPNHFHGIVEIVRSVATRHTAPDAFAMPLEGFLGAGSLSVIARSFKSEVTRRAKLQLHCTGGVWQTGYFDRVIRDAREFADATRYIVENPARWKTDTDRPAREKKHGLARHPAPLQKNDDL